MTRELQADRFSGTSSKWRAAHLRWRASVAGRRSRLRKVAGRVKRGAHGGMVHWGSCVTEKVIH